MTSLELDAVVIGGGVVGLAVARALVWPGARSVLEAEPALSEYTPAPATRRSFTRASTTNRDPSKRGHA